MVQLRLSIYNNRNLPRRPGEASEKFPSSPLGFSPSATASAPPARTRKQTSAPQITKQKQSNTNQPIDQKQIPGTKDKATTRKEQQNTPRPSESKWAYDGRKETEM